MQAQTAQFQIVAPRDRLSFFDIQSIDLPHPTTPLQVYAAVSADMARRLNWAFTLRDLISRPFGVRAIGGFSGAAPSSVAAGDRLDFFLVEAVRDGCLVLTERDRHLDVMTCITCHDRTVSITSSVLTHNGFGKAYMTVVGPAHRMIVARGLRRLAHSLS